MNESDQRRIAIGLLALFAIAICVFAFGLMPTVPGQIAVAAAPDEPKADDPNEPWDDEPKDAPPKPELRKLTDAEVSRIRYMELRAMRGLSGLDRVTVKVPRDVVDEFLVDMTGHEDFRGKRTRREFLKQTPPQKLHTIAHYKGAKYADKVEILTDPEIFLEFRKRVMPQVIRGCATSGCHNAGNEALHGFQLFNDPKKVPGTTYANFLTLNDYKFDGHSMINRNDPSRSLIATYMLPSSEVPSEFRHPGNVEFRPIFQSHKHPRFQRILRWIGALKIPAEDYGVRLVPRAEGVTEDQPPAPDDETKSPPADGETQPPDEGA